MALGRVDRIKILVTLLLLLCPMAVGTYRASRADYDVERIAPSAAHRVHLRVFYETAADTIRVRANLPQNETNLSLGVRWTDTNLSGAGEYRRGGNRILEWWGETEGRGKVETAFTVIPRSVAYDIDPSFRVPGPPSESMLPFLESTEVIQVDDPAIAALAVELAPAGSSSAASLRRIYDYCRSLPGPETAPDTAQQADDALGTLESQAGSELGRVRLFAALARHQGIPTRLVQGIVLEPGLEIDPATWVEVRLGPAWVPFHPARALFARTAGMLVPFARGDVPIVEAGSSADLEVRYAVEKTFAMRGRLVKRGNGKASSSWLDVWAALEESGIPVDIQRIALMIPFGALMTIFVRNILGLRTFGFFLPLLVAITATRAGLGWTLSAFLFVIGLVYAIRLLASPLRLLHFPMQGIMLTTAVIAVIGLAAWGALKGNVDLAQITFLPVVVLTIASERFSTIVEEEGPLEVIQVTFMSIVAIVLCFLVMNSWELQTFVLTFPESLLAVVFVEVLIGSWTGIRVLEYFRFRRLIPATEGVVRA